jgi:hypothetical protein
MKNRMLSLALSAAMTAMFAIPAMAQDNFPDVPENHWAFEAIENLKREGILVGYPDGTYKGPRATTRYELAVALNAAYQRLKTSPTVSPSKSPKSDDRWALATTRVLLTDLLLSKLSFAVCPVSRTMLMR